jgi:hypothetical protein
MVRQVLEITFMLVLVYLIVSNAEGFSAATKAVGSVYANSVKVLQGR